MKIARLTDNVSGTPRSFFQTSNASWYDVHDVLGETCHLFYNWVENCARLQSADTSSLNPVTFNEDALIAPLRPTSFRDFYAFEEHVSTCRKKRNLEMNPDWYEIPVFYFSNPFSMRGPGQDVFAPEGSMELDFELELGVVIGHNGKNISAGKAWDHVAGFTIINDFSARDLQRREMGLGLGPTKGKDFATGLGPYFVSFDEVKDHIDGETITLDMTAVLNGKTISQGNSASMYHRFPQLIAQASRDVELQAGDLIGSGTVGSGCILELGAENTGGYLKAGDCIELTIEKLGTLRHHIIERK